MISTSHGVVIPEKKVRNTGEGIRADYSSLFLRKIEYW